jgi:hypothetical protein
MAAFEPFEPAVQSGAAGSTQSIALGAGSATSQTIKISSSISNSNNSVLVTCILSAGTTAYVRLSAEASTAITATATDTPFPGNSTSAYVRLFASPNMTGAYNIAVIVTATPTTAGTIWFTPGQGGF